MGARNGRDSPLATPEANARALPPKVPPLAAAARRLSHCQRFRCEADTSGMVATTNARSPGRRSPPSWRRWLLPAAFVAVLTLSILGVLAILGGAPSQLSSDAGACSEVTSSGCRPFLDAVYENLGRRESEVASVRGRHWCGQDSCQVLFGGEAIRLRVTFYDGTSDEFSCWRWALGEPSCEPADSPGGP
jgi:hypothetical protein